MNAVAFEGTPKDIDEAIERLVQVDDKETRRLIMIDFLAQRFGVAMMKNSESTEAINDLWIKIKEIK